MHELPIRIEHEEDVLRGLAASRGVYEGPARRVSGPTEFGRIRQGDVLVTESLRETINARGDEDVPAPSLTPRQLLQQHGSDLFV